MGGASADTEVALGERALGRVGLPRQAAMASTLRYAHGQGSVMSASHLTIDTLQAELRRVFAGIVGLTVLVAIVWTLWAKW
jgi:hypothetical protein